MRSFEQHKFYCIGCGQEGIPLMRKTSRKKESFHRKKIYCIHCKCSINHIECQTDEEVLDFKEQFANGEFTQEAEESLAHVNEM